MWSLLKTHTEMRVKIVHHQMNYLCSGIDFFYQPAHESHKIRLCAPGGHLRLAMSSLWIDCQSDVVRTSALIFVDWRTRLGCNRCPGLL